MTVSKTLKETHLHYRTVKARIKYQERILRELRRHAKWGTFPKWMTSIKPYQKMTTPEAQKIVDAACDTVKSDILEQVIVGTEMKLKEDEACCLSLINERGDLISKNRPTGDNKNVESGIQ